LVGGFAASDWLFSRLKETLEPRGLSFCRPDRHVYVRSFFLLANNCSLYNRNKAVADGAISFYLDHFVATRISRFSYGTSCVATFDPSDIDHVIRSSTTDYSCSGERIIPGVFDIILPKVRGFSIVTLVYTHVLSYRMLKFRKRSNFVRDMYARPLTRATLSGYPSQFCAFEASARILAGWMLMQVGFLVSSQPYHVPTSLFHPEMYSTLCTIQADTSLLSASLRPRRTRLSSISFYLMKFDIILSFGLTELKAQVCWEENVSVLVQFSSLSYIFVNEGSGEKVRQPFILQSRVD